MKKKQKNTETQSLDIKSFMDTKGWLTIGVVGLVLIFSMGYVQASNKAEPVVETTVETAVEDIVEDKLPEEAVETQTANTEDTEVEPVIEESKTDVYHVEWGDTLSEISGETGVSLQSIAKDNDIDDVNLIYDGQSLQINK